MSNRVGNGNGVSLYIYIYISIYITKIVKLLYLSDATFERQVAFAVAHFKEWEELRIFMFINRI